MGTWELLLTAASLSMDAFAVAVCKGLSAPSSPPGRGVVCGLYFGAFQAIMPLLGWLLGVQFQAMIVNVDHWIAFGLLVMIGVNMIKGAGEDRQVDGSFTVGVMLPLALATSIDALAVGITFAFLQVDIVLAVAVIGVTTFLLSTLGVRMGARFGARLRSKAELAGGAILILMGVKILLEHLFAGG